MDAFLDLLVGGAGLDLWGFLLLCSVSFAGSLIAAAMGLGGGTLMLVTMALFLPPAVLIPVHGVVQFGSNFGRTVLMVRDVLSSIIPVFLIGTILGALIGGHLVINLPTSLLQAILAFFVLYATWAPKFQASSSGKRTFFGVGTIGAFATMFVGATGPLIAPFVSTASKERQQVVATLAMLMAIQHGFKIIAFGLLDFAFGPYIPLLVGLLAFGFAGTWSGKLMLNRLPEQIFRVGLKTILTLLSLRLLYSAAGGFLD